MNAEYRRKEMYDSIQKNNALSVAVLAEQFGVSTMTIRRDLHVLESQNLVEHTYGKVVLKENKPYVDDYHHRITHHVEAKQHIAALALPLLRDMETIYIDSSTTCHVLVNMLPDNMHLTIYTNSLHTLDVIRQKPWLNAFVFGGMLSHSAHSLDSTTTLLAPKDIYVDAALVSCAGFDRHKVFNNDLISINERRIMLQNADKRFLLADASKADTCGLFSICTWDMINVFVTNQSLEPELDAAIRNKKVQIITR